MARQRTSMKKIRDLIRLKSTTQMSDRQIAGALQISRPLVGKYWRAFQASGLKDEQIEGMADSEVMGVLKGCLRIPEPQQEEQSSRYGELAKEFPHFVEELKRTGVTLQCLWQEYTGKHPQGYRYSRFCYHFQNWRESSDVRMHIEHKAGEKMFVDYAGKKLMVTDPQSGVQRPVEVFVAILGASELTYVEASESQGSEDWVLSNDRAVRFFGGVVQAIIPDNLRSAVSRVDPYEPGINLTYDDFAEHYGTVIMPARVRKARDKALAEGAVRLCYQRIYAPLRNRTFFSLQELNEAI